MADYTPDLAQTHRHGETPVTLLRDPRLPPACKALYGCLQSFAWDYDCHPSQTTICDAMGWTDDTLRKWAGELERFGYLQVEAVYVRGMRDGTRYHLLATREMLKQRIRMAETNVKDSRPRGTSGTPPMIVGSRPRGTSVSAPDDHRGKQPPDLNLPDQPLVQVADAPPVALKEKKPKALALPFDPDNMPKRKTFVPPTVAQAVEYFLDLGAGDRAIDLGADFVDFWTSAGWKRKSGPVLDWQSTARLRWRDVKPGGRYNPAAEPPVSGYKPFV